MNNLNVAILGARGIGKFHAREFNDAGCNVCAVLGSTQESSARASVSLKSSFNIDAKSYLLLEKLLEDEKLDAVSICTPPELHESQVRACLNHGLHVLCEKPFITNQQSPNYDVAKELIDLAKRKNKILTVNTQWPSILPLVKPEKLISLDVSMEPGKTGLDMLYDHLPHANSLLVNLIPNGQPKDIRFPVKSDEEIKIQFDYANADNSYAVGYHLKFKADRPRTVAFSFNGESFTREISAGYQQTLISPSRAIPIEDPLKVSIRRFVSAINEQGSPLISHQEILENVALQDAIVKEYLRN